MMIIHIFIIVYWTYNTHLIVTVRSKKFRSKDYIYAFHCYWGDWFSNFWFGLVYNGIMEPDDIDV